MRQKSTRVLSGILSFCMIIVMIPTHVFAIDTFRDEDIVINYADYSDLPARKHEAKQYDKANKAKIDSTRSLEELKSSPAITWDENGNAIAVNGLLDPLTDEEIALLFTDSDDVDVVSAFESSGVTREVYDAAIMYHGSEENLVLELSALRRNLDSTKTSPSAVKKLRQLIFNGYTYDQAKKAIVTAEIFGITTEALCEMKVQESSQKEIERSTYSYLAKELGVPVAILDTCMPAKGISETSIIETVKSRVTEVFIPIESSEEEMVIDGSETVDINAVTSSSDSAYYSSRVLENAYDYKSYGDVDVNLSSGSFRFSETDLHIPGVNGLDLNIGRIYDSSISNIDDVYISVPNNSTKTFRIGIAYATYTTTGDIIEDLEDYSVTDNTTANFDILNNTEFANSYEDITPAGLLDGISFAASDHTNIQDIYSIIRNYFDLNIIQTTTPNGNTVSLRFTPYLEVKDNYKDEYSDILLPNNEHVNRNGLGNGWRLNIPAFETPSYTIGSNDRNFRIYLSDGRILDAVDENSNGSIEVKHITGLEDLTFDVDTGYSSNGLFSLYSLKYADGRKEYFNGSGRCMAIVDRFGNTIEFKYTMSGSVVTKIEITDTYDNKIVYEKVALTGANASGEWLVDNTNIPYNTKHTLSIIETNPNTNQETKRLIRSYYSYDYSNVSETNIKHDKVELVAVVDELGQVTIIGNTTYSKTYNYLTLNPDEVDDKEIRYAGLTHIRYPNNLQRSFVMDADGYELFGPLGYKEKYGISEMFYSIKGDVGQDYYKFDLGDNTGYETPLVEGSTYTTKEHLCYVNGSDRPYSYTNEHVFDRNDKLIEKNTYVYNQPGTGDDDDDAGLLGIYKNVTYSYSGLTPYPTAIAEKTYEPGNSTNYLLSVQNYFYDGKGNVLMEVQPNGMITTYTYDDTFNLPLSKTYDLDEDTTVVETNSLSSDKDTILEKTVKTNNVLTGKSTYTYDNYGRLTSAKVYSSGSDWTTTSYSYGAYTNGVRTDVVTTTGIVDADGNAASGTTTASPGTVTTKTTYNLRGWPVKNM